MRGLFREKILWVSILILLSLASSCTTQKTTGPAQPTVYLMKDYFPLNEADEWIWEVAELQDSTPEPFLDGDVNLGEPFIDMNENGIYDEGIDYFDSTMDLNENGKYDGPDDPWTPGVPYWDRNNNGEYDPPNGKYDEGELFSDLDTNGIWNWILNYHTGRLKAGIDSATSMCPEGSIIFIRCSHFLETGEDSVDRHTEDGFSNDSLGLRWHWHTDWCSYFEEDDLEHHAPVIIAKAEAKVSDSMVNADTSYYQGEISGIYTWISIFEGVEDVTVPAGTFRDCLKFKTRASGWEGNMAKYNGTSYQWYAKDVGMLKSEGPNRGEYWRLESAIIDSASYP